MKKAILISGIIWGVVSLLTGLICLISGVMANNPDVIAQMQAQDATITLEQIKAAASTLVTFGVICLIGGVFSFVLVGLRNSSIGKGAGIAIGIIGIVLEATLPGIFFIIDSAKTR